MQTTLHTEWMSKVLLYSTGNYIQDPVINHKGKERVCAWVGVGELSQ